jgi:ribonuclease I
MSFTYKVTFINAQHMRTSLDFHWPNYLGRNIVFWEHEWNKHGTCTYEVFDQTQYFSTVIHIFYGIHVVT